MPRLGWQGHLLRVLRISIPGKRSFQQRLEGGERVSRAAPWEVERTENMPGSGNRTMGDM